MKKLAALFISFILVFSAQAEEISGKSLNTEMAVVKSHLDQVDGQIEQIRRDIQVDLNKAAWVRVIEAGRELDSAGLILRDHPQRIAMWDIWWDKETRKEEKTKVYSELFDRHASLNRILIPIEEKVGQALGADFGYIRTAIRSLRDLCEKTGDPRWCDLAEEVEALFTAGNFSQATNTIQRIANQLPESELSPEDRAVLKAGPQIEGGQTATAPGSANLQQWLSYLRKACEETQNPELCREAERLAGLLQSGNIEGAQELVRSTKRYMQEKNIEVDGMPPVTGMEGRGEALPSGTSAPAGTSTGSPATTPDIERPSLGTNMQLELDGKTYFMPNGWDKPGYLLKYNETAYSKRLEEETEILVDWQKNAEGILQPKEEEIGNRIWAFDIIEADSDGTAIADTMILKLVDNGEGKSTFTVSKWEVLNAEGATLYASEGEQLNLPLDEAFPNVVIIRAHGETDWGNPFSISVTTEL